MPIERHETEYAVLVVIRIKGLGLEGIRYCDNKICFSNYFDFVQVVLKANLHNYHARVSFSRLSFTSVHVLSLVHMHSVSIHWRRMAFYLHIPLVFIVLIRSMDSLFQPNKRDDHSIVSSVIPF